MFRGNLHDEVFSGKSWLASDALHLGLIDEINSSDDYIFRFHDNENTADVFEVYTETPVDSKKLINKLVQSSINAFKTATNTKY